MTALTAAERETRLSMMGDDHGTWDVFTDDSMWIDRLDRITSAIRTQDEGKWYTLRADQVVVRIGVSEAKKAAGRKAAKNLQARQDGKTG